MYYHGSPFFFDHFELTGAGEGTGIRFGYGVYLTEVETTAVHYSQPRNMELTEKHYLYTVEIPELKEGTYLMSGLPVDEKIVAAVEDKLGVSAPEKVKAKGLEFRKWIGKVVTGITRPTLAEQKLAIEIAAANLLDSIGVYFNVWPYAQTNPDGPKNVAVFNASRVHIVKVEEIEIERSRDNKWVLTSRKDV